MTLEFALILGFIFIQFIIGFVVSRSIKSSEDYFLAGRSNGYSLVCFSIFATWFGSESCISSAGMTYKFGLSGGRADPLGFFIGLGLFGLLIATKVWKAKVTTIGDILKNKFGSKVELICSLIILFSSLLWAAAQLRAFGIILSLHSGFNMELAILIATLIALSYSLLGGLMADNITDLVQSVVLILGLIFLAYFVLSDSNNMDLLYNIPTERLKLFPSDLAILPQLDSWLIPVLATLTAQELFVRASSSRSAQVARRSSYFAACLYLLFGLIPVVLGLIGPDLIPDISNREDFLMLIAKEYMPNFMFVFFSAALVSIVLSTVDSNLLAVGALLSQNIVPYIIKKDPKKQLRLARFSVLLAGVIAFFLASSFESVFDLVMMAASFGMGGILVLTLAALYSDTFSARPALISILVSLAASICFEFFVKVSAPFLYSILLSVTALCLSEFVSRALKARA